jgi:hypothetical protein
VTSFMFCVPSESYYKSSKYRLLRPEVISCWNIVMTFVSELTLAVGRTKRCSGIWFETDMPSSCFAVHVWVLELEWLR